MTRPRVGRPLWLDLDAGDLLSWPVLLGNLAWSLLAHFGAPADNGTGRILVRAAIVLISFVMQSCVLAAAVLAVRGTRPTWLTRAFLGLAIVLAAGTRGASAGWFLAWAGVTPEPQWAFRISIAIMQSTMTTALLWLGVTGVRRHLNRRRELLVERDRLALLRDQAQERLADLDVTTLEAIRTSIVQSLAPSAIPRVTDFLERLRLTIDDVVRPLSQRLEAQSTELHLPEPTRRDLRIDWWEVVRQALEPGQITPLLIPVSLAWIGLPTNVFNRGVAFGATITLLFLTVGPLAFGAAKLVASRLARGRSLGVRAAAFLVAVLVAGEAFGLATVPLMRGQQSPYQFVLNAPVFALAVALAAAFAKSTRGQAERVEADLADTATDLQWHLARAREEHRQRQRALAHALHGRVQATIAAAILQLERASQTGLVADDLVRDVQARVVAVVEGLDLQREVPDDLRTVVEKVRVNWAGASHIEASVSDGLEDRLRRDPLCLMALNDLVPELVFNSVKHGRARVIIIDVRSGDEPTWAGNRGRRTLELAVHDDGKPAADGGGIREGLGSRLLADCAIIWSRESRADGTVTRALLPLAT